MNKRIGKRKIRFKFFLTGTVCMLLWVVSLVDTGLEKLEEWKEEAAMEAVVKQGMDEEGSEKAVKSYWFNGKLTLEERKELVQGFLEKEQAELIFETCAADKVPDCYYAYDSGKEAILVDGQPINLNIIFRYDEKKSQTECCLASPIYMEDF